MAFLVVLVILSMASRDEAFAAHVIVILLCLAIDTVQVNVVQLSVAAPALI
jgi:hypothetical protein